MKFRKKPVVIEAVQYTGKNMREILAFTGAGEISEDFLSDDLEIPTLEGTMKARAGDWIIRGVKGEFYPCKPDIFEATYDQCGPRCSDPFYVSDTDLVKWWKEFREAHKDAARQGEKVE